MKNILILATAILGLTACVHTPTGQIDFAATFANAAPAVQTAAYEGTRLSLLDHPDWLKGFQQANDDLKVLVAAKNPDYTTLAQIIGRLPVNELKSEQARIIIEGGEVLLQQFGRPDVVASKLQDIRPIVVAIQLGLDKALANAKDTP